MHKMSANNSNSVDDDDKIGWDNTPKFIQRQFMVLKMRKISQMEYSFGEECIEDEGWMGRR